MSEPLPISSPLIALSADFHVRTLATQACAPAYPGPVLDSGGRWCEPFAWYDRGSLEWRTWQLCLDGEWALFWETWPRAGMTLNGIAYQRPPLVPSITEIASGLPLVPTPTACDHKGSGRPRKGRGPGNNLRDWFRQLHGFLYPPVAAVEYLMGYPTDWTVLKDSVTRSSRRSPNGSPNASIKLD